MDMLEFQKLRRNLDLVYLEVLRRSTRSYKIRHRLLFLADTNCSRVTIPGAYRSGEKKRQGQTVKRFFISMVARHHRTPTYLPEYPTFI